MKNSRRFVACAVYIALGAVLFGLGFAGILDSFWSGMGSALIAVGIVRSIQLLRYSKDAAYREEKEIEAKDERNRFLRNKAWACAGYLFVIIAAIATIAFRLLGQDLLSMAASAAVSILVLLYWIAFMVLKKKY